jgi:iron(III) transport system ATP-binding protein
MEVKMAVGVRIENLAKTFDRTIAVDDVSLDIQPGELFFLLGPSGCGKTTLLRCVAGFCDPDRGSIHIGDHDITRLPPHKRDTGMVFQSYALWPHMTVKDNIAFGLQMRKMPRQEMADRVSGALDMVKMSDRADHNPNQLSGGQQQRVALARALVVHPQCLLLDEPLSNLDAKLRVEMRSEIRRICKQAGLTAIYVTHDQKEALSIADRLAVLHEGSVQQVGTPQEVYHSPVNTFTAGFIGETNLLKAEVLRRDTSGAWFSTPLGEVVSKVSALDSLNAGDQVTLSIRPEAIRVSSPPESAPNAFNATIHDTVYLGEVAQHRVSVFNVIAGSGETTLKAFDLNPRIVARDTAESTRVWIAPEDVVVLGE